MKKLLRTPILFSIALLPLALFFSASSESQDATAEILKRIDDAKKTLAQTQRRIETESKEYSQSLQGLENSILSLRSQAGNLQRLSDEKILGIDELEKRLDLWNTQSAYQRHLMGTYISSTGDFDTPNTDASNAQPRNAQQNPADLLPQLLARTRLQLEPTWQSQEIVAPNGDILPADTLKIGPIQLALNAEHKLGGVLNRPFGNDLAFLEHPYSNKQYQNLGELKSGQNVLLNLDPSLGNAARLEKNSAGIGQHVEQGGFWVIPILVFGALSLIISLIKAVQLYRLPKNDPVFAENIAQEVKQSTQPGSLLNALRQRWQTKGNAQDKLAEITLSHPASETRENLLVAFIMEYKHKIERYLGVIAMAAAVAPLLGLLGTVSGMIETFKMMSIFGASDPSTVSGGISEALVTTELGLIVAIPSLLLSALLSRKTRSYIRELDATAIKLSKLDGGIHA